MLDRRAFLACAAAVGLAGRALADDSGEDRTAKALAAIGASTGGRLGVAALDTGSGQRIGLDADSPYALC